ncbi:hypothetical protein [Massilia cavernae]|uniref:hypothetical protein n=1 Tax=Massilia cavernae TaxID=2320864 RepID=UPI0027D8D29A|nr:hypothetical protein [Massilia cavernae]
MDVVGHQGGQGMKSRQVRLRSAMRAAGRSHDSDRSPVIVNGRSIASLVRALSHGRALFQS